MIRTINTVPGLGDIIWIFQKLLNQQEKFHWRIWDGIKNGAQAQPQRGHQIFKLVPQLVESFEYAPDLGYNTIRRQTYWGKWRNAPAQSMYLQANTHLEEGHRIEEYLRDLPTTYKIDYETTDNDYSKAFELLFTEKMVSYVSHIGDNKYWENTSNYKPKCIGIYTSAYNNARIWDGWQAGQWIELIRLINNYDRSYKFVLIGAEYDVGIPETIMANLHPSQYINTIGQPLSVVIEILKRLDCFIGFPSGLSIINETLAAKQTVMFYPKHLHNMINTWADPERISSGAYKGCLFCEPKQIFDWLIENKKI